MKQQISIPAFRIEQRPAGDDAAKWSVSDLAWTGKQRDRLVAFRTAELGDAYEVRAVDNAGSQVAITEAVIELETIAPVKISESEPATSPTFTGTPVAPAQARSLFPFGKGDKARDKISGNVVTVVDVNAERFMWLIDEPKTEAEKNPWPCPWASAHYYEKLA